MKLALGFSILMTISLACSVSSAGAESHGGQAVSCPGKQSMMLDYYQATLPNEAEGSPDLVDLASLTTDEVISFIKLRLAGSLLADPFERALEILGPINTWLEGNLQSVPDSEPAYALPADCSLKQVAIRQESTVYVDPTILSTLSPAQIGILITHEALYYIAEQSGLNSSVEVRMVIRNLLMGHEDLAALSKAVHEMGQKFFWWEYNMGEYSYKDNKLNIWLSLYYDPMTDGDQFEYMMTHGAPDVPDDPDGEVVAQGKITCDGYQSNGRPICHMVSGPHQCILTDFTFMDDGGPGSLELQCSDLGFDVVVNAKKSP